jgi:hypothetical protein
MEFEDKFIPGGLIHLFRKRFFDRTVHHVPKSIRAHFRPADAENEKVLLDDVVLIEMVKRGNQLPLCEISRGTEDDEAEGARDIDPTSILPPGNHLFGCFVEEGQPMITHIIS